jgi:hypothetical protein
VVVISLMNEAGRGTMSVTSPGSGEASRATALVVAHRVHMANGTDSWPQVAVLGYDGFCRLNRLDSGLTPCFGTSHILPPSLPVPQPAGQKPLQSLHPYLDAISWRIDAEGLPALTATGGWYDGALRRIDATWSFDMLPPTAEGDVSFDVGVDATVLEPVALPAAGGFQSALGLATLSSMYSDAGSFDADVLEAGTSSVSAGSLTGAPDTTIEGTPLPLQAGDSLWMRRSMTSDHNTSASDEGITVRCAVVTPAR